MKCVVIILQLSDRDGFKKNIDDIKNDILNAYWELKVLNSGGIFPNGDEYDVSIMNLQECNLSLINKAGED